MRFPRARPAASSSSRAGEEKDACLRAVCWPGRPAGRQAAPGQAWATSSTTPIHYSLRPVSRPGIQHAPAASKPERTNGKNTKKILSYPIWPAESCFCLGWDRVSELVLWFCLSLLFTCTHSSATCNQNDGEWSWARGLNSSTQKKTKVEFMKLYGVQPNSFVHITNMFTFLNSTRPACLIIIVINRAVTSW